ncbi:rRNA maturation RNase YbeY [Enterococcus hirae]|jgi:probable rRNA maturation factor|nr:rRNA maturation RNase YbeY [Enterococcaceae bacterium]MCI1918567.1 rRNA maturation RNase YbeY [Enterococcaceae bacterium]MDM8212334.1 rRNA maturation RNase YbeY [Enterococcus hirae]
MEISMIDETNALQAQDRQAVHELLEFAADFLKIAPDTEMSITFVDDAAIHKINREYRDIDRPTDVISFAIEDMSAEEPPIIFAEEDEPALPRDLGDIFISLDHAHQQAEEYGHSFERELGFLALHGFLHLNGYDHLQPEEEKEMFGLQKRILDAYGLKR